MFSLNETSNEARLVAEKHCCLLNTRSSLAVSRTGVSKGSRRHEVNESSFRTNVLALMSSLETQELTFPALQPYWAHTNILSPSRDTARSPIPQPSRSYVPSSCPLRKS